MSERSDEQSFELGGRIADISFFPSDPLDADAPDDLERFLREVHQIAPVFTRVITGAFGDPSARVRESAALVLHEAWVRAPRRRAKLPAFPWKNRKDVRRWPLVMITGSFYDVDPPKRLPTWVVEEVVRRLRHRAHPKVRAGVSFLRRSGKALRTEVMDAVRDRVRRRISRPERSTYSFGSG